MKKHALSIVIAVLAGATVAASAAVPPRPEQIAFPPLTFNPPKASEFRSTLDDGTPVYMYPSHEFPLINLSFSCMGGSNLDPADKPGLVGMATSMMRRGGTTTMSADQVDERLEFMATNLGVRSTEWTTTATMDCLKANFDESLAILIDILKNPGFDDAKFKIARGDMMEALKQRNDDAGSISGREWAYLVYGQDHFESRQPTGASISSITTKDMRDMAAKIFHPGNMIISVTGDFDPKAMIGALNAALADWPRGERNAAPVAPTHTMTPGIFFVEKDIPQGKVTIGMRSIQRDNPDFYAYTLMNEILGGGGFSSRVMQRVRSDEGLAYSAGTGFRAGAFYPGTFRAGYESKNATVALAAKLIFEEFDRMRNTLVSPSELEIAKKSFIETFPSTFASKTGTLGVFVADEWTNRPAGYWENVREKIAAVTPEEIQRVAQKYLDPSQMTVLVVGKWSEIAKGDLQGRAKMDRITPHLSGAATEIPMRDPVTLEPISQSQSGG